MIGEQIKALRIARNMSQVELAAAHQRTDVEYSPEAAKSDLDSMSDENF